jgi:hypothetical protein
MKLAIVMVHRVHLPRGYLVTKSIPLLASDDGDQVALLPARLWAKDLVQGWLDLGSSCV